MRPIRLRAFGTGRRRQPSRSVPTTATPMLPGPAHPPSTEEFFVADRLQVLDGPALLSFTYDDMLRYSGPHSPAGVAMAFQAMRGAFPRIDAGGVPRRREIWIDTAFRGPGGRDGFELVTRAVTEGRYTVTADLERPELGMASEQFVF